MRKYYRRIQNKIIYILIDDCVFRQHESFFCSILRSYSICANGEPVPETSYYIVQTKDQAFYPSEYSFCISDINSTSWIFDLINDLDFYYSNILQCTVIHGSCIRVEGKNILIIGERWSGKTTLTHFLATYANGEYVSDDCVYILNNDYLGFCMPLPLRNVNSINIKDDYQSCFLAQVQDGDQNERTLLLPQKVLGCVKNIDIILFPKYDTNISGDIQQITHGNAFNAVMKNVRSYSDMGVMCSDIKKLTSEAQIYKITYPNSYVAYELLTESALHK